MDNDNQKINTGNKGVFPGTNVPPKAQPQNKPQPQQHTQQTQQMQQNNVNQPEDQTASEGHQTQSRPADSNTYMNLSCKNAEGEVSGVLDIDLISFRERGQESRYLSINSFGADREGNQSEARIYINNEEDFNRLKEFISNLNWND